MSVCTVALLRKAVNTYRQTVMLRGRIGEIDTSHLFSVFNFLLRYTSLYIGQVQSWDPDVSADVYVYSILFYSDSTTVTTTLPDEGPIRLIHCAAILVEYMQ